MTHVAFSSSIFDSRSREESLKPKESKKFAAIQFIEAVCKEEMTPKSRHRMHARRCQSPTCPQLPQLRSAHHHHHYKVPKTLPPPSPFKSIRITTRRFFAHLCHFLCNVTTRVMAFDIHANRFGYPSPPCHAKHTRTTHAHAHILPFLGAVRSPILAQTDRLVMSTVRPWSHA